MTKNQTKTNEGEIDLLELAQILLRRIWLMVLSAVLLGAMAFGYTYFRVTPLYTASALMYVNNSGITVGGTSFTISGSEISAAKTLVDTYSVILKTRTTLEAAIEEANLPYSYEELYSMVTSSAVNSTEIFQITVTSASPTEAELIANTLADLLPEKISGIVAGSDVRVVDYAVIPASRISPSYTGNTAKGAMVGIVLAAAYIVLRYLLDDKIHSEDYLTQAYPNVPLLAVVPNMSDKKGKDSGGYYGAGSSRDYRRTKTESRPESRRESAASASKSSDTPRRGFMRRNEKEGGSDGE